MVEQTSAKEDGFPDGMVHGPDNLVRIPTYKHWELNAWYATKRETLGNMSYRDYLRGKSWEERVKVGHKALIETGVLKP